MRVGRELDAIITRRGKPLSIVSDNGTELTYEHVVLVLPAKKHLADYTPWISHYRQSVIKHQPSNSKSTKLKPQIAEPRYPCVHAISVDIPWIDAQDEAAIASLAT